MNLSFPQIQDIILNNPNKKLVKKGQDINNKLLMHLYGVNVQEYMKREDYFENAEVFSIRKNAPTSNKDIFARILQEENLIFAARGGSAHFNLDSTGEDTMNNLLSDIRNGQPLRNWIETIALPAYRVDPMGVILMEVEQLLTVEDEVLPTPKCYPTYKSIQNVYDYLTNGRQLEYVIFRLTLDELAQYGIKDTTVAFPDPKPGAPNVQQPKKSNYFRVIDDGKDLIVKLDNQIIYIAQTEQQNPIVNDVFNYKLAAFVVSDIQNFNDQNAFCSPLDKIVELADNFLYDRSIRDLQKRYHGFAKAIEPLLKCPTCQGLGVIKGGTCPDCTQPGQSKGSGYKMKTKVSDVSKFPLEILEKAGGFDFKKIFGYVTPDIESWDKQDLSLQVTEQLTYFTYWGCAQSTQTSGVSIRDSRATINEDESATKTLMNLKPKYTRLNRTADWAQSTENRIADLIATFWLDVKKPVSNISYSRNYILETAEELLQQYFDMRKNGAPDPVMDEQIARYYNCLYEDSPLMFAKAMKLLLVDPFPHDTYEDIDQDPILTIEQKLTKRYFGKWSQMQLPMFIIDSTIEVLTASLLKYAQQFAPPATQIDPATGKPPIVAKEVIATTPSGN